jgi:hypothetical protein
MPVPSSVLAFLPETVEGLEELRELFGASPGAGIRTLMRIDWAGSACIPR